MTWNLPCVPFNELPCRHARPVDTVPQSNTERIGRIAIRVSFVDAMVSANLADLMTAFLARSRTPPTGPRG
jgi:hypothetical protein